MSTSDLLTVAPEEEERESTLDIDEAMAANERSEQEEAEKQEAAARTLSQLRVDEPEPSEPLTPSDRQSSVLSHGVVKELSGRTKKKVSALDKKVTAAENKLQRLKDKLEAAYDEFGSDSPKVVKLNDLISKTNRQVASLKMKQYKARNSTKITT